jgi:hypothetical protein
MSRIVFELCRTSPDGVEAVLTLALAEPSDLDGLGIRFKCPADDQSFVALSTGQLGDDAVLVAGQRLYQAVSEHPRIGQKLAEALEAESGERAPIYVKLRTAGDAEALPWEALCSPAGDFLGLDERWSLARIVEPTRPGPIFFAVTPEIRIAAVLSCLGDSAEGELNALHEALSASGLADNTKLLVITSEEAVYNAVKQEMASPRAPYEIRNVHFVPNHVDELGDIIKGFAPHILHFFCHGSKTGAAGIELATKRSWQTVPPRGLIPIEARAFQGFRAASGDVPWLITLNCCEGAGVDTTTTRSLALELVHYGIAPAVIGMREVITRSTANELTRVFYRRLLNDLAGMQAKGDTLAALDWARLVTAARDAVARKEGDIATASRSTKQWTLPVLYLRSSQFVIQLGHNDFNSRRDRREVEALRAVLIATRPAQVPEAAVFEASVQSRIAELVRSLRSGSGSE